MKIRTSSEIPGYNCIKSNDAYICEKGISNYYSILVVILFLLIIVVSSYFILKSRFKFIYIIIILILIVLGVVTKDQWAPYIYQ